MVNIESFNVLSNHFTMKIESLIYDFHGKTFFKSLNPADRRGFYQRLSPTFSAPICGKV